MDKMGMQNMPTAKRTKVALLSLALILFVSVAATANAENAQQMSVIRATPLKDDGAFSAKEDPAAAIWSRVREDVIDLNLAPPVHQSIVLLQGATPSRTETLPLRVSVITDKQRVYFRLRWKDATRDEQRKIRPGKHMDAKCSACHPVDNIYTSDQQLCIDCHKNDKLLKSSHRKRYGDHCEQCHSDRNWQDIHFVHDKDTKYPLRAKHKKVKCDACHLLDSERNAKVIVQERICVACRVTRDVAKIHMNMAANQCAGCHHGTTCRVIRDKANADHGYQNRSQDASIRCEMCHLPDRRAHLSPRKAKSMCVTCHVNDDLEHGHKRGLGAECETCHDERAWSPWVH